MNSALVAVCVVTSLAIAGCGGRRDHVPTASISVASLRVEGADTPLGIDARQPRMSWAMAAEGRDVRQSAYQIRVLREDDTPLFDSGKVTSDQATQVKYAGPPLQSGHRYSWQVRVWNQLDAASEWSAPSWWELGLLDAADWTAEWIEPATAPGDLGLMLRRAFRSEGDVSRARVYVTSLGLYRLFINGQRVGNDELTPGWTSYRHRLQYQTYDVTAQIKAGDNAVGALLGSGWYSGEIGFDGSRNSYGNGTALLAQLELTYKDGRVERIVTDGSWKSSAGPILLSSIYDGETYDARLEQAGWNDVAFNDSSWAAVKVAALPKTALIAQSSPPVRKMQQLTPKSIERTKDGRFLVDMGQNMVGWVRLAATGPAGTTVTLRHAEILEQGRIYAKNLRSADQVVRYTLSGKGAEVYEPHFTFQGFRYVEVEGYPGELAPQDIAGIVLYSSFPDTGEFHTSNALLNQLQSNIVWGQRGNFVDVPTDCPQRDERLGWTGDAQVFAATAAFNADVNGFFAKWLKDLAADQQDDGAVPYVVPDVFPKTRKDNGKKQASAGAAGWSDAATIIPWAMYQAYGDRQVLQDQYSSMKRWVGYQRERAGADLIWEGDFHFGDWLDFGSASRDSFGATDTTLIATAYFAYSANLLSRSAEVLGMPEDAAQFAKLFADVSAAFQRKFVTSDGKVGSGTQTAYVLALQFELLPAELRSVAAKLLAEEVRRSGHLTTGFLGTPGLLFALSDHGYLDEAYGLLMREGYPSWLYPVKQGATTIWERWDGVKPDGTFQTPGMNSFNHYAYGAVGEWMYRTVAGINIDPAAPGYKQIVIKPRPGGGLTQARASHLTPYGRIASSWSIEGGTFRLTVEIPPNTTANVSLPKSDVQSVREGGGSASDAKGVHSIRQVNDDVLITIGSGRYEFTQPWRQ